MFRTPPLHFMAAVWYGILKLQPEAFGHIHCCCTVLTISIFTMHMRFNYIHNRQSEGDNLGVTVCGSIVLFRANEMATTLGKHFG